VNTILRIAVALATGLVLASAAHAADAANGGVSKGMAGPSSIQTGMDKAGATPDAPTSERYALLLGGLGALLFVARRRRSD
jgi:MYXO-CTERM domain-containing protein